MNSVKLQNDIVKEYVNQWKTPFGWWLAIDELKEHNFEYVVNSRKGDFIYPIRKKEFALNKEIFVKSFNATALFASISEYQELKITNELFVVDKKNIRKFVCDDFDILLNDKNVQTILKDEDEERIKFFGNGKTKPVIITYDDEIFGIILPFIMKGGESNE